MTAIIATGRSLDYGGADGHYWYLITYCVDDVYQYATRRQPQGWCGRYGGGVSFERCRKCPDVIEVRREEHKGYAVQPLREMCPPGDFAHDLRRKVCRRCSQRLVCALRILRTNKKVVLKLYTGE